MGQCQCHSPQENVSAQPMCLHGEHKPNHSPAAAAAAAQQHVGYPAKGWERRAFVVQDDVSRRPLPPSSSGGSYTIGAPRAPSTGVRFEAARALFEEEVEPAPSEPECSICLEAISTEEEYKLPCCHVLHQACARQLVVKKGKAACPLCRKEFVPRGKGGKVSPPLLTSDVLWGGMVGVVCPCVVCSLPRPLVLEALVLIGCLE